MVRKTDNTENICFFMPLHQWQPEAWCFLIVHPCIHPNAALSLRTFMCLSIPSIRSCQSNTSMTPWGNFSLAQRFTWTPGHYDFISTLLLLMWFINNIWRDCFEFHRALWPQDELGRIWWPRVKGLNHCSITNTFPAVFAIIWRHTTHALAVIVMETCQIGPPNVTQRDC